MKGGVTPLDLDDKAERAHAEAVLKAIVIATTHYQDAKLLAEVSEQVPSAMKGLASVSDRREGFAADSRW